MTDNRRHFSRIPFDSTAHIYAPEGDLYLHCPVIDISLKGILVVQPENWHGKLGDQYTIDLLLENGQIVIKMAARVAHIDAQHIGFSWQEIDLDSMTHLKRLLELNLGDSELLHRELNALIHQ